MMLKGNQAGGEEDEEEEDRYSSIEGSLKKEATNALHSSKERLAKQALAATGGKSNLKATKWLLERRNDRGDHIGLHTKEEPGVVSVLKKGDSLPWSKGGSGSVSERLNVSHWREDMGESPHLQPQLEEQERVKTSVAASCSPEDEEEIGKIVASASKNQKSALRGLPEIYSLQDGRGNLTGEWQDEVPGFGFPDISSCFQGKRDILQDGSTIKRKWQDEVIEIGQVDISSSSLHGRGKNLIRNWQNKAVDTERASAGIRLNLKPQLSMKRIAPLAERMRPNSISEILGQDHLVGPHCILRSLLDGESLPCIIFGGPSGTGKSSLARLIARSASCRFIVLHEKPPSLEVREILDEAKQAMKSGRRTVLFVERLNAFSKFHQEQLLPAIKEGYLVLIGATTTKSPSTGLISSLLQRCKIFTLKELQHEDLCSIMQRAISDVERGVRMSLGDVPGLEVLAIKDEAINFLATAASGDARVALNALEDSVRIALQNWKEMQGLKFNGKQTESKIEVNHGDRLGNSSTVKHDALHDVLEHLKGYFQFSQEEYAKPFKKIIGGKVTYGACSDKNLLNLNLDVNKEGAFVGSTTTVSDFRERVFGSGGDSHSENRSHLDIQSTMVVTIDDAKEAFQWQQHEGKEKSWEENDEDLISAMLKAMRGGHSNAAVYWFSRAFETVENPLRRIMIALTKFASEEIGMADPQALVQAVSCHQACELMGGEDCTSYLIQCVVYLSMAPKSNALPRAFRLAQRVIRGLNEPVKGPMHLRSSSSSGHMMTRESHYLQDSLKDFTFVRLR